jgi:gamma-glutamylcysteine synthetase
MKWTHLFFGFIAASLLFCACGDDEVDCTEAGLNEAIQEETMALEEALEAYILNPDNSDACQDLKDAYDAFIDQAKELQDCADEIGEGEEYMNSIQQAETALDQLEC